ncbi:MAG: thiamine pyrophosphate-dependent enzyme [Qingshengfaniella sp.]
MTRYQDGGEALLDAFRSLGIEHVFCASGSEWAPVWEAFTRQELDGAAGPVYHDLLHETLAVDMAIGYTLVTGQMQAVLLHATPGLLQGSMGIHGALLSEVPMLVFSSEANSYGERDDIDPGSQWYRNLSFVGGPHSVTERFTKWSCQVPGVSTIYEFTKRAGEIATRVPQGPVYLNTPVEVLLEPWERPATWKDVAAPGQRIAPDSEIADLVAEIRAAKSPMIITESLGRTKGGQPALIAFAEAFGIPVYESQATVAQNFPRSHPLYQGGNVDAMRDKADLILLVDCRSPWYPPSAIFPGARVVVIDAVPQRPHVVYQVLQADRYIEGEVPHTLTAAAALATPGDAPADRVAQATAGHDALLDRWTKAETAAAAAEGIDPTHLAALLRDALPEDTLIFDEAITHARLVRDHVRPDREMGYSYIQGGLGQGIGVALGAKLAAPDQFVMLTVGDGAFLYNPIVQALAAARDLPVLVVVFNNRKYLSMKFNHLRFYKDGQSAEANRWHGVDLDDQPELAGIARACGVEGILVTEKADLPDAIARAIETVQGGTTCVLNVMTSK